MIDITKVNENHNIYIIKSVEMLDMEGRPLRRFDSIKEAGETSHINTSDITKVCKGKVLSAGKYKWRYC